MTDGYAAELTELVRGLADSAPLPEHGRSEPIWAQVQELGLAGIGITADRGGSGGELPDLLVVIRELGRAGLVTPIVEASVAMFALGAPTPGSFDTITVAPELNVDVKALTVDLGLVAYAPEAARLVLVGRDAVASVDLGSPQVRVDATTDIAGVTTGRVTLTKAEPIVAGEDPEAISERLAMARTAALAGAADGAYELTRKYLCEREQFGGPLIEIQAVASGLAQMAIQLKQTGSALEHAVDVLSRADASGLRRLSAVLSARVLAAATATEIAHRAHQLHGAMGVTREYPLHRYTTALWAWRDADIPEQALASRLGAVGRTADESDLWEQMTV